MDGKAEKQQTSRTFSDSQIRQIAAKVAGALRQHESVSGGVSVRATLSFIEVCEAFRLLDGTVTVASVYEAAFSTFGSRLNVRGWRDPDEVLRNVLDRILFDKKVEEGIMLKPQEEDDSAAIRGLIEDLMALSVSYKHGPEIKRQARSGVYKKDLSALLRERYEEGKRSLPNLSRALMNSVRQAMKNGVFSPSRAVSDLLENLEDFNLLKKDSRRTSQPDEEERYRFTKGAANLVGEEAAHRILGEDYHDLVDDSSGEIGESLSREQLSKLLGELQVMLDLLHSGRLASSIEALIHFYGDQFPTLSEALKKLSPMTSSTPKNSWETRFDNSEELSTLLKILKREKYFENGQGPTLTTKAYELIFEDILPEVDQSAHWGEHESVRGAGGDGEIIGLRPYRRSDRFRDLSFGATVRQLVKNRRYEPEIKDLRTDLRLPTRSLDVILAIDSSRSMAPHGKLLYAKKAAVGLALAATRRGDRVGVLSFSDYASDVVDPSGGVNQAFIRRIADLRPLNSTNVEDALRLASSTLQRSQMGQKHVILITDGVPTSCTELFHSYQYQPYRYYYGGYFRGMSIKAAYGQARRLVDNGITISTICVERDEHVDRDFCTGLSRLGKCQAYFLKDERDLPKTTLREYHRARNT
jgi:uncharacterized protein with von Willebrand factor type A (vWA) domain